MEDRRSLRRRRLHVRSKLARSKADSPGLGKNVEDNLDGVSVTQKVQSGGTKQVGNHASLSLSLSLESYELREELAKVTVLSLVRGNVNEGSVLEVKPSVIATKIAGPIVPLNESSFLIPFENRNKMREVVKLGTFDVMIKDGKCTVNLAHWMAELGALGRADGDGQWVKIWNFPLYGWCWSVIERVLRPVGELIALSKMTEPHTVRDGSGEASEGSSASA